MKQLILNEINKQYIYYVMIVDILISIQINEFRLKSILFFASLFIIYSLIKDDHKIWITLINNDRFLKKIVFSKMVIASCLTFIVLIMFSFSLSVNEIKFLYTLSIIYLNCFILYTYVIPDGYVNTIQINVLQYYCILSLYLCCFYHWQWFDLFIYLADYMLIIMILMFVITIFICKKTMRNIISHQIALNAILKENRYIQQILYENNSPYDHIENHIFNKVKNVQLISIIYVVFLQLQVELILCIFTIMCEIYTISLFLGIILIGKAVFLFSDCAKKLKKVGCKR